jgi:hypothetical protein
MIAGMGSVVNMILISAQFELCWSTLSQATITVPLLQRVREIPSFCPFPLPKAGGSLETMAWELVEQ